MVNAVFKRGCSLEFTWFALQSSINICIVVTNRTESYQTLLHPVLLSLNIALVGLYLYRILNRTMIATTQGIITVKTHTKKVVIKASDIVKLVKVKKFYSYYFLLTDGKQVRFPGHLLRAEDRKALEGMFPFENTIAMSDFTSS